MAIGYWVAILVSYRETKQPHLYFVSFSLSTNLIFFFLRLMYWSSNICSNQNDKNSKRELLMVTTQARNFIFSIRSIISLPQAHKSCEWGSALDATTIRQNSTTRLAYQFVWFFVWMKVSVSLGTFSFGVLLA
jgi:hypothetical protein